jgi:hypothetical protein
MPSFPFSQAVAYECVFALWLIRYRLASGPEAAYLLHTSFFTSCRPHIMIFFQHLFTSLIHSVIKCCKIAAHGIGMCSYSLLRGSMAVLNMGMLWVRDVFVDSMRRKIALFNRGRERRGAFLKVVMDWG